VQERGYLAAGGFEPFLGQLAILVNAGRVAVHFK
jgi:hypothetical protein